MTEDIQGGNSSEAGPLPKEANEGTLEMSETTYRQLLDSAYTGTITSEAILVEKFEQPVSGAESSPTIQVLLRKEASELKVQISDLQRKITDILEIKGSDIAANAIGGILFGPIGFLASDILQSASANAEARPLVAELSKASAKHRLRMHAFRSACGS